jgi:hypothetical protein
MVDMPIDGLNFCFMSFRGANRFSYIVEYLGDEESHQYEYEIFLY